MKILQSTFSLSRNGGGIFEVVRHLTLSLRDRGLSDLLVTGPEDGGTKKDAAQWSCLTQPYQTSGPRIFGYSSELKKLYDTFSPDLTHVHGIWMYYSIANLAYSKRTSMPYIVSPHGMLDSWALGNSDWKKKLAKRLYEGPHLRKAACLHALCKSEEKSMREYGLTNPICVIPNAISLPQLGERAPTVGGKKTLLFLGRIHPKKGLRQMIVAFSRLPNSVRTDWQITIAGWDQNHEQELKELAAELSVEDQLDFVGPKFGDEKVRMYEACDAFILPSLSEGLPMTVLEAWSYAKPTIITPACNLPEGLMNGATIECEADEDSLQAGLQTLFSFSADQRQQMGANARVLVEQQFTWSIVAEKMHRVYEWLLGNTGPPETVRES